MRPMLAIMLSCGIEALGKMFDVKPGLRCQTRRSSAHAHPPEHARTEQETSDDVADDTRLLDLAEEDIDDLGGQRAAS